MCLVVSFCTKHTKHTTHNVNVNFQVEVEDIGFELEKGQYSNYLLPWNSENIFLSFPKWMVDVAWPYCEIINTIPFACVYSKPDPSTVPFLTMIHGRVNSVCRCNPTLNILCLSYHAYHIRNTKENYICSPFQFIHKRTYFEDQSYRSIV